jgi:hypothetical protein
MSAWMIACVLSPDTIPLSTMGGVPPVEPEEAAIVMCSSSVSYVGGGNAGGACETELNGRAHGVGAEGDCAAPPEAVGTT